VGRARLTRTQASDAYLMLEHLLHWWLPNRNPFMKNIFWGAVIIANGLAMRESGFGRFHRPGHHFRHPRCLLHYRGLVSIYRAKQQEQAMPQRPRLPLAAASR